MKPWFVGQRFGENAVPFYKQLGMMGHNGLDAGAYRGQQVFCGAEGKVFRIETEPERGLGVEIISKVGNTFYRHAYWHFIGINENLKKGTDVEVGTLLGWADSTGMSTGDHLHLGVKECREDGTVINYHNGYKGAIDPEPMMFPVFALDVAPTIKKLKEVLADLIEVLALKVRK